MLAFYFAGVAFCLLYGEKLLFDGEITRGEQLVFSLAWPLALVSVVFVLIIAILTQVAMAVEDLLPKRRI